ncbi:uromodulin-like [Hyperolius riggenbachi]|uniref:uromodulin-like n=1 Tax=Hyperolius riggenbachi TaxID=752182 RepID=UPI0035A27A80
MADPLPTETSRCATKTESSSLTFLVDTTESMYDDLQQLKLINGWLLNRVAKRLPCSTPQYTLVEYNDPMIGPIKATESVDDFHSYFDNLTERGGGGGCPEKIITGLEVALTTSPPNSFILVLTDASAKDYDDKDLTDRVYELITTTKSKIFFLITGLCEDLEDQKYIIYRDIASKSAGHVFRVSVLELNKVFYYLDFTLSRPIYTSVHLFSGDYKDGIHSNTFTVKDNFTELVLTTDGPIHALQLTRPVGSDSETKAIIAEDWGSMFIVKTPALGTWTIDMKGSGGSQSIRVEGFKAKNSSCKSHLQIIGGTQCSIRRNKHKGFSCILLTPALVEGMGFPMAMGLHQKTMQDIIVTEDCSECHPDGTCEEYFGFKECSCNGGYIGDGFACSDIDECNYTWTHTCQQICVNTIGSFRCECKAGYIKNSEQQCVDIDECSASGLNMCHSQAVCSNHGGTYTCKCPHDHWGDGVHCELDECKTGICGKGFECIKQKGSYTCVDPCLDYTMLNEPWRSTSVSSGDQCDITKTGWFRFTGNGGSHIPEMCIAEQRCSTGATMWINGSHPSLDEGIVTYRACASWSGNCCHWSTTVQIKACPLRYHVYNIHGTPSCPLAYCTDPATVRCSCAEDEECKIVNEVEECYCSDGWELQGLEDLDFGLKCNSQDMMVSFRTCQLKSLNVHLSSVHFSDTACTGAKEGRNTSMISVKSPLQEEQCGIRFFTNGTHAVYTNTLHVHVVTYDVTMRNYEVQRNFSCVYALDLYLTSFSPVSSSVSFNMEGTGHFTAHMVLYKDEHYLSAYDEAPVLMSATATLYIGVILDGTNISQFVVLMKNCYVTPNRNGNSPKRYDIIKDRCPNKEDENIKLVENGVSSRGLFSVQIFKVVANHKLVYLHCEINLCDNRRQMCKSDYLYVIGCYWHKRRETQGVAPILPNLNPIENENLWSNPKQKIYESGREFTSKQQLWEAILTSCNEIPAETF